MNTELPDNQNVTVENCVASCSAQNFTGAGLEFSGGQNIQIDFLHLPEDVLIMLVAQSNVSVVTNSSTVPSRPAVMLTAAWDAEAMQRKSFSRYAISVPDFTVFFCLQRSLRWTQPALGEFTAYHRYGTTLTPSLRFMQQLRMSQPFRSPLF